MSIVEKLDRSHAILPSDHRTVIDTESPNVTQTKRDQLIRPAVWSAIR